MSASLSLFLLFSFCNYKLTGYWILHNRCWLCSILLLLLYRELLLSNLLTLLDFLKELHLCLFLRVLCHVCNLFLLEHGWWKFSPWISTLGRCLSSFLFIHCFITLSDLFIFIFLGLITISRGSYNWSSSSPITDRISFLHALAWLWQHHLLCVYSFKIFLFTITLIIVVIIIRILWLFIVIFVFFTLIFLI